MATQKPATKPATTPAAAPANPELVNLAITPEVAPIEDGTDLTPTVQKEEVTFSAKQQEVIREMFAEFRKNIAENPNANPTQDYSVYQNVRDPKKIESINVRRWMGKYVIAYKDHQVDDFKREKGIKQYTEYAPNLERKDPRAAYLTLILSNDGVNFEEVKVLTSDYVENRDTEQVPVLDIKIKKKLIDNGRLGGQSEMGRSVDSQYKPDLGPAVRAEYEQVEMYFVVQLRGFANKTEFLSEPNGGVLA